MSLDYRALIAAVDLASKSIGGRSAAQKNINDEGGSVSPLSYQECCKFLEVIENINPYHRSEVIRYFVSYVRMKGNRNNQNTAIMIAEQVQIVPQSPIDKRMENDPMDHTTLAARIVSVLTPYFANAGSSAATKIGENAVDNCGRLLSLLRGKLTENRHEALKDFEANPADADTQATFRQALKKTFEADETLADELKSMLPPEANSDTMTQDVRGDNAKAVQIKGSDNTTNVG